MRFGIVGINFSLWRFEFRVHAASSSNTRWYLLLASKCFFRRSTGSYLLTLTVR
jgi:hypothetical protein